MISGLTSIHSWNSARSKAPSQSGRERGEREEREEVERKLRVRKKSERERVEK